MKFKSLMTMMVAAVAIVLGNCSCSSDDDEPEVAVASQVLGTYSGNEVIMVMNEESSNETRTYQFTKVSDTTVDMLVPEAGMGMMTIPAFPIKNIPLTKSGNTISGELASYSGKVTTASGDEKAYTVSDVVVLLDGKNLVVLFSLKYGSMPMAMDYHFTGIKQ